MSWTTTGEEPAITRNARVPIDQSVMSVLSAATYTEEASLGRRNSRNKNVPLGFLVDQSTTEEDESARPRKKAKSGRKTSAKNDEAIDDANKKHRGRPRIEGQDETAVDRRRTQIRLAQRAYRNRKETTIATLKQQNDDLQQSIARMVSVFQTLQNDLKHSQALRHHPNALQQLQILQHELDHATTLSAADEQNDKDSSDIAASAKNKAHQDVPVKAGSSSSNSNSPAELNDRDSYGFLSENHSLQKLPQKTPQLSFMDINGFDWGTSMQSSYFDWSPNTMQPGSVTDLDQTGLLMGNWGSNGLNLERSFPQRGIYTYSFQETTFARRLHRLCLERSFRALTDHTTDPGFLARTFRFTLFYLNKSKLREGLQKILQKKAGESLENWEVPYFHVGGAGTHYPRRDATGMPIFPPNLQSPAKAPGPWQLVDGGSDNVDSEVVQTMLAEMGYAGEWFDAHDVEEYLKSKGVFLDGSSSFVEVDTTKIAIPTEIKIASTSSSAVPTLAASPSSSHSYLTNSSGIKNVSSALNDQLNLLGPANLGLSSQFAWSTAGIDQPGAPGSPGTIPTFEQVIRRKQGIVTFDVERFLERVTEGGSCLGRAPGFRKDAVDSALALAVHEAF